MEEKSKLKSRWFIDSIASSASARGKKEGEYVYYRRARKTKAGKTYTGRRGRLVIMKLIKIAGPQVIFGPSVRKPRIPSLILR